MKGESKRSERGSGVLTGENGWSRVFVASDGLNIHL